ncbi:MAG: hypothetical protein V2B14_05145 [bacterium]
MYDQSVFYHSQEGLKDMDADKDKKVSMDEFKNSEVGQAAGDQADELYKYLEGLDGKEGLSTSEYGALLEYADRNKDGKIDESEKQTFLNEINDPDFLEKHGIEIEENQQEIEKSMEKFKIPVDFKKSPKPILS